jgi:pyrimidine and pyridine-specific 5'-nucleotidase
MQALRQANVTDPSKCLFVDDNRGNVDAAVGLGWGRCVHFCERGPGVESVLEGKFKEMDDERLPGAAGPDTVARVSDLEELRVLWSDIFRQ